MARRSHGRPDAGRDRTAHRHRDLDGGGADGRALASAWAPTPTTIGGDVLSEFGHRWSRSSPTSSRIRSFPEAELARLKTNLSRNLAVALSQPQQLALQKFRSVLYGDHPFGRVFPTDAMIAGYTAAQVKAFHDAPTAPRAHALRRRSVRRASRGGGDPQGVRGLDEGHAGRAELPSRRAVRAVHLVDRPGAPQSTIVLGVPTMEPSSDDFVALTVMDALLGGAFGSRITRNIREDKGYTYSPYSEISTRSGTPTGRRTRT